MDEQLMHRRSFYVGGAWVEPAGRERLDVVSPATEQVVGSVPVATDADIDRAVDAAHAAFTDGPGPDLAPAERADVLARAAELLADERTLLGLSDAGAHATQLCDACFSTHLLGHWVRDRKALSLETAVWRLTGHPHVAFRVPERGLVQEGFFADLVAFDPDEVGCTSIERVHDQPGGTDRLVVRSTGVDSVWVNGTAIRRAGTDVAGVAPGRLLRS